jgi:hypothetical protein
MCNYVQQQRSLAKQICLSLIKIASAYNHASILCAANHRHIFHWYLLFCFRLKEHLFTYLHPSFIIYCSSFAYHALLTSVSQMIFPLKGEHFCQNNFIVYLHPLFRCLLFTVKSLSANWCRKRRRLFECWSIFTEGEKTWFI